MLESSFYPVWTGISFGCGHLTHSPTLGGLPDETAALYLQKVNEVVDRAKAAADTQPSPYSRLPPMTFSFGRGLQGDAMQLWVRGDEKGACEAFKVRARACWKAARGGKEN